MISTASFLAVMGAATSQLAYSAAKAAVIQLAGTVAYLASDDADSVTASAFPVDGGITAAFTVPS